MLCFWGKSPFPGCLTVWPLESHGLQNRCLSTSWETHTWTPGVSSQHSLISGSPKRVPSFQVGTPRSLDILQGVRVDWKRGRLMWPRWCSRTFGYPAFSGCAKAHSPQGQPQASSVLEKYIPWHRWGAEPSGHTLTPLGAEHRLSPVTAHPSRKWQLQESWPKHLATKHATQQRRSNISSVVLPGGYPELCFASSEQAVSFSQAGEGRPALVLLSKW